MGVQQHLFFTVKKPPKNYSEIHSFRKLAGFGGFSTKFGGLECNMTSPFLRRFIFFGSKTGLQRRKTCTFGEMISHWLMEMIMKLLWFGVCWCLFLFLLLLMMMMMMMMIMMMITVCENGQGSDEDYHSEIKTISVMIMILMMVMIVLTIALNWVLCFQRNHQLPSC